MAPPLTNSHGTGMTPPPPTKTQPYKAIAAFVLTFLSALLASIQGRKEFTELTPLEWVIIIGSALVTAGTVYGVTNPAKTRT